MLWILIIAGVVAFVLYKSGVFRKPDVCRHCGKQIKGTEQVILGRHREGDKFVLCKQCASAVSSQVMETAIYNWSYEDYTDYLAWNEETRDLRAQFRPTYTYDAPTQVMIDADHGLFKISSYGEVFRFEDVADYHFRFEPIGGINKDGKLIGKEKVEILMKRPAVMLKHTLFSQSAAGEKKHPTPGSEHVYLLSEGFGTAVRMFSAAWTVELAILDGMVTDRAEEIKKLVTAMFLYDFEDMIDVTVSNLEYRKKILDSNVEKKKQEADLAEAGQIVEKAADYAYDLLLKYVESDG